MLRLLLFALAATFLVTVSSGQVPDSLFKGIHQIHNETFYLKPSADEAKMAGMPASLLQASTKLVNRKVIGWHPYWAAADAYQKYNYNALTHIAYFSYEVDIATGGYLTVRDWNSTPIISYAHNRGTKVLLTVTNFGSERNTVLLSDTVKQTTLLNSVRNLLISRNGDGVNFDFESLPLSQRENMVDFIRRAVRIIRAQLPAAEISIATPAVDWSGSWDLAALGALCDYIIIMGYDYYWRGSSTAGPVAPLEGENYNVTRTVNTYLSAGVPADRLLLGVPWYGYDWPVTSSARKATATGTATARFYSAAVSVAESHSPVFDQSTKVPWLAYLSSANWRQMWYDDPESLGYKYDLVAEKDLAGIGIWALSYEGDDQKMWSSIVTSFSGHEPETDAILKIYPIPATGPVTVEMYLDSEKAAEILVYDYAGRETLIVRSGEMPEGFHMLEFDMTGFATGVYLCVMRTNSKTITRRLLFIGN
ncbi:MAG: T9SS type A sorting domain-containing protein [Bacteroidetes bacterium]|nr:T9SS type A sorting domain-containing protein [Bacteroidota bacterium]